MKGEERAEDRGGILDLRVVADMREIDHVCVRDQLPVTRGEMGARHGVERAVDEAQRDVRPSEDVDPARAILPTLFHVPDESMKDAVTACMSEQGPELVDERRARRGVAPEDGGHAGPECALAGQQADERTETTREDSGRPEACAPPG